MSDVKCPYCGTEQEINHDDGYGYEDGTEHEQCCVNCDEEFVFVPSISFSYNVYCRDGEHDLFPSPISSLVYCSKCDHYQLPDEDLE